MTDDMEPTDPRDLGLERPVGPGTVDDQNRRIDAYLAKPRARNCTRKCWVARGKKCACPCAGANHGKDRTIETFAEINARPPFVLPEHIEPGHEESLKEMFNKLDAEEKLPEPKIGLRGRLRRWRSLRRIARGP